MLHDFLTCVMVGKVASVNLESTSHNLLPTIDIPARDLIHLNLPVDTGHGEHSGSDNNFSHLVIVQLANLSIRTSAFRMLMLTVASAVAKRIEELRRVRSKSPRFLEQQAVPGLQPETAPVKSDRAKLVNGNE